MSDTSEKTPIETQDAPRPALKPERMARVAVTEAAAAVAAPMLAAPVAAATALAAPLAAATLRHFGRDAAPATATGHRLAAGHRLADAAPPYIQLAATQWQQTTQKLFDAAQATGRDLRALIVLPHRAGGPLHEMQQAMSSLVAGAVEGRFDAADELLRLAEPAAMMQLHHRFVQSCLDTLMQGSAILVESARATLAATQAAPEAAAEVGQSRVGDVMQRDVHIASPDDTVQQAARRMQAESSGVLPVGDATHLVGMVTDRELALCLAADGRDPARTRLRDVMTSEIAYVFEDEALGPVAETMAEQQVLRLPVLNRDKRVVGVVSLADLPGLHRGAAVTAADARPQTAAA
jgi:CBS domain-containing protein